MISHQVDEARLAYGRLPIKRPRQFTLWGTSNKSEYRIDDTGNRRFWPITIGDSHDPEAAIARLAKDRDQLWAEAAHYEAQGESLLLPKHLRDAAQEAQNTCRLVYPWHDTLAAALADRNGFIPSSELWRILGILTRGRHRGLGGRQAGIMPSLGFEPSQRRVNGKSSIRGYLRKGERSPSQLSQGSAPLPVRAKPLFTINFL
jgi:hypothetical protein